MKTSIQIKSAQKIRGLLIAMILSCTVPAQVVRAVSPPPDGGYPGGNTAEGHAALLSLTIGTFNTAVGWLSLRSLTHGNFNTAIGAGTLLFNIGGQNTATGAGALLNNVTGHDNTAYGAGSLLNNTSGDSNIALGVNAGLLLTTGNFNIDIGNPGLADESSTIRIGNNLQTRAFVAGIHGVTTGINNAIPVLIDSLGQLGTVSSSRRFKKEIKPMDKASEAILALAPVTFHYRSDNTNRPEFGLIAEEVAKVNPDLVVRHENGETYTVRYDAVNAMLLNEFLKEHRKVEKLEATVAALAAQIEKLSTQRQTSTPATQVAVK
jgi:Chaperone of endosialidase